MFHTKSLFPRQVDGGPDAIGVGKLYKVLQLGQQNLRVGEAELGVGNSRAPHPLYESLVMVIEICP